MLIILVHLCTGCLVPMISLLAITGLFVLTSLLISLKAVDRKTESISLRQNSEMFLRTGGDSEWRHVEVSSGFVAGWLITLKLSDAARRKQRSLVCFPDSMSRDDFRRLTVFVRLHGPACSRNSIDVAS